MQLTQRPSQVQKQAMTPAMWMGLNLLQLPIGELRDAVKKEVESNPAIEDVEFSPTFVTDRSLIAASSALTDNLAAEDSESLEEHLLSELEMSDIPADAKELCAKIIENLDENGRFVGSMPDLVMITGASEESLERSRAFVMSLDPLGCGAKDLVECFRAQLKTLSEGERAVLDKELDSLMSGKLSPAAIRILKKLDPFPGKLFDHTKPQFVNADIKVDRSGNVEIETKDIPEINISPKYLQMAKDKTIEPETRKYAAERVNHAREFRAALVRRQQTLMKIATLAIAGQEEYLKRGKSALKRQTMVDVAKEAKCHVATVSRAAARKYVRTPFGVVPLRAFFVKGEKTEVEELKKILKEYAESGNYPGDRVISEELQKRGVKMARRTVAKYRAKLYNIPKKEKI